MNSDSSRLKFNYYQIKCRCLDAGDCQRLLQRSLWPVRSAFPGSTTFQKPCLFVYEERPGLLAPASLTVLNFASL